MATFADLTINDGAATPVARTFKVKKTVGTKSSWEERSGGVPVGYWRLDSETRDTSELRRVKLHVVLPVLEAVAGTNPSGFVPAPAVAYSNFFNLEFGMSQRSSQLDRNHLYAICKNALNQAIFGSMITAGDEIAG